MRTIAIRTAQICCLHIWTRRAGMPEPALCEHLFSNSPAHSISFPDSYMWACLGDSAVELQNPKPGWWHRCWFSSGSKDSLTSITRLQVPSLLAASPAGPFQILGMRARSLLWQEPAPERLEAMKICDEFTASQLFPSGLYPCSTEEGGGSLSLLSNRT